MKGTLERKDHEITVVLYFYLMMRDETVHTHTVSQHPPMLSVLVSIITIQPFHCSLVKFTS